MLFLNYSPQELRDAIEIEMQKTDDAKTASIIAIKRLKENPLYYLDMRKAKDISKLVKKKVVDKRGHTRTVYVRMIAEEKKERWVKKIAGLFGLSDRKQVFEKIKADYNILEMDKKRVSWDSWKNHISEYFNNKEKWDNFFSGKKEKREKGEAEKKEKKEKKTTEKKIKKDGLKLSVMKSIYGLYGGMQDVQKEAEKPVEDNFDTMPETEPEKTETPIEKKIDNQAVEAINTVTPENRTEKEAEAMGEVKEPWSMTFEQYKKTLFGNREERVINQLTKDIEHYKKIIFEAKDGSSPYSQKKWATERLSQYKEILKKYMEGSIDEKEKPNPTWDYLQKQYNSIGNKNSKEAKSLKRKLSIKENKAKKEHKRLITKAIKEDKIIPADVLKEYPELSKDMAKEITIPDINYQPKTIQLDFSVGSDAEMINLSIKDYSRPKAKDVYLIDDSIILDVPRPSYIPGLDLESFSGYGGRNQNFDVVRLEANKYILVDKRYQTDISKRMGGKSTGWVKPEYEDKRTEKEKIEQSLYYLMSAETLAATWDYYQKLYVADELKKHEDKQDEEEAYYNKQKKEYEAKGREWPYAEFKRTGKRVPRKSPNATSIAYRNAFMIADFLGMKSPEGKGLTQKEIPRSEKKTSPEKKLIFDSYQSMLTELNYKINDMRIQKQYDDESDTYKKGQETAYGDSGLKDNLKISHGIMVKRQNGAEIQDQDITKIGMLMDNVFSVFGNRKSMSQKYGLKISYAGEKRMHASKAIGMFIPKYKTIAISDYSIAGRGFTFAHEFAHFMDAYIGDKQEQFFSSDKDGTISNTIAKTFRSKMNFTAKGKGKSDYVNRTCECFARAMEQFYAIKKGEDEELYKERNIDGRYVEHNLFVNEIMPLCEQFFLENELMLKAFYKKFNSQIAQFEYRRILK